MSSNIIGKVIGNLEVVSKIAAGGMGVVYRAEHRSLRTPYAVKILHTRFLEDKTSVERFRREAVTCSQLRHPNVVFVTDFGYDEALGLYLIMEFLEGMSLAHALKTQGAMTLARVARIGEQICEALEAAHALNIVHRDLKPDNIFLCAGGRRDLTKVLDFGIAQIQVKEDVEKLTRAGLVLGTPAYISPEQINGKAAAVGPGADIYALGSILYEMVGGNPPFTEGTDFEILSQHMFKAPEPISAARPDLAGSRLEALLNKMLEKRPEDRPESMTEVHQMLTEAIEELRERGLQDAFYQGKATGQRPRITGVDTGQFISMATPPPLRITNVIQRIKTSSPDSAAASLLNAFPGMAALQEEIFLLALWGVLQRDLLDQPLGSEPFKHALDHTRLFIEVVLNAASSEKAMDPTRLFRSLRDLFRLAEEDRQHAIVQAIQDQTHHHLFPFDILPEWAQPGSSGTWRAFKNLMTTEIKLPFNTRPKMKVVTVNTPEAVPNAAPAAAEAAAAPAPTLAPATAAAPNATAQMHLDESIDEGPESVEETDYEGSLAYKLNQDLSIKTLKNVLSHEIKLFGRAKKKTPKDDA